MRNSDENEPVSVLRTVCLSCGIQVSRPLCLWFSGGSVFRESQAVDGLLWGVQQRARELASQTQRAPTGLPAAHEAPLSPVPLLLLSLLSHPLAPRSMHGSFFLSLGFQCKCALFGEAFPDNLLQSALPCGPPTLSPPCIIFSSAHISISIIDNHAPYNVSVKGSVPW